MIYVMTQPSMGSRFNINLFKLRYLYLIIDISTKIEISLIKLEISPLTSEISLFWK